MVHLSSKPFLSLILYLTPGKQVPLQKIKKQVHVFSLLIFSNMADIVGIWLAKRRWPNAIF